MDVCIHHVKECQNKSKMYMEVCTLQVTFVSEKNILFNDNLFIEKLPNGKRQNNQETSAKILEPVCLIP